jgi:hypothetical protein
MKQSITLSNKLFTGFYESIWYYALENHEEMLKENIDNENHEALSDILYNNFDFNGYQRSISKEFVFELSSVMGIDLRFESLFSPTFYNYMTDQITISFKTDDLKNLIQKLDDDEKKEMTTHIKTIQKQYDGISFETKEEKGADVLFHAYLMTTHDTLYDVENEIYDTIEIYSIIDDNISEKGWEEINKLEKLYTI